MGLGRGKRKQGYARRAPCGNCLVVVLPGIEVVVAVFLLGQHHRTVGIGRQRLLSYRRDRRRVGRAALCHRGVRLVNKATPRAAGIGQKLTRQDRGRRQRIGCRLRPVERKACDATSGF